MEEMNVVAHVCNVCKKGFSSGQMLGGHKSGPCRLAGSAGSASSKAKTLGATTERPPVFSGIKPEDVALALDEKVLLGGVGIYAYCQHGGADEDMGDAVAPIPSVEVQGRLLSEAAAAIPSAEMEVPCTDDDCVGIHRVETLAEVEEDLFLCYPKLCTLIPHTTTLPDIETTSPERACFGEDAARFAAQGFASLQRHLDNKVKAHKYFLLHESAIKFANTAHKLDLTEAGAEVYRQDQKTEYGIVLPSYQTAVLHYREMMRMLRGGTAKGVSTETFSCPIPGNEGVNFRATTLSLRQTLTSVLGSSRYAPGCMVVLGGDKNKELCEIFKGVCGPIVTAPVVQAVANSLHEAFEARGLGEALLPYARSLGKTRVRLFCAVFAGSIDGAQVSTRDSVDYLHFKGCYFAHHAFGSRDTIFPPGFIKRPEILSGGGIGGGDKEELRGGSGKVAPEVDSWSKNTFAKALHKACLKEIEEWDKSGPLLLERIPGCDEEDNATLWVVEPALAFLEGDFVSLWEVCGLKKLRCLRCFVKGGEQNVFVGFKSHADLSSTRSSPDYREALEKLYAVLPLAQDMPKKRGGHLSQTINALEALGHHPVLPFTCYMKNETPRIPFGSLTRQSLAEACYPDILHSLKQGLFADIPPSIKSLSNARGTLDLFRAAFNRCSSEAFFDGVRYREQFESGLDMSFSSLAGRTREWLLRTMLAALHSSGPSIFVDPSELEAVLFALEDILQYHHICGRLFAGSEDFKILERVTERFFKLGAPSLPNTSNWAFPKMHNSTCSIPRAMVVGGAPSNWSMEGPEAVHTGGRVLGTHVTRRFPLVDQLAERFNEAQFFKFDLEGIRGRSSTLIPSSVTPPSFFQRVHSWDYIAQLTEEVQSLWSLKMAAYHGALSTTTDGFFPVKLLSFTRSSRFGQPIMGEGATIKTGDFVRLNNSLAADSILARVHLVFYFKSGESNRPKCDSTASEEQQQHLYFLGEQYCGISSSPPKYNHHVRVPSDLKFIIQTSCIYGKALVWQKGFEKIYPNACLYAPALERRE